MYATREIASLQLELYRARWRLGSFEVLVFEQSGSIKAHLVHESLDSPPGEHLAQWRVYSYALDEHPAHVAELLVMLPGQAGFELRAVSQHSPWDAISKVLELAKGPLIAQRAQLAHGVLELPSPVKGVVVTP